MKHEEIKRRDDYCIELAKNGHTFQEIADAVGTNRDYVRQILARYGIKEYRNGRKPPAKIDKYNAIKLLQSGLMPKDVAKELGCATSTINALAKKEGLSFEWRKNAAYKNRVRSSGKRNKRKEQKHEEMRAYKAEGYSYKKVAEHFGVSCDWAKEICRGIARQDLKTQFKKKELDEVKAIIKASNPDLEYVSGYKNADSKIEIRCTKCGNTFSRSFTTIRHSKNRHGNQKKTRCDYCYTKQCESQKKSHKKLTQDEKERRKAERHLIVIQARAKREAEKQNEKLHECPVCGQLTTRRKYCSEVCCREACKGNPSPEAIRRHNAVHDAKRRALIKEQIVDKDITLKELFKRDGGICWICGMMCDWSDFTRKNGYFVAGNLYPSIDHVVELSNGGAHSWDNVKLAHRICNVKRYYAPISRAI